MKASFFFKKIIVRIISYSIGTCIEFYQFYAQHEHLQKVCKSEFYLWDTLYRRITKVPT